MAELVHRATLRLYVDSDLQCSDRTCPGGQVQACRFESLNRSVVELARCCESQNECLRRQGPFSTGLAWLGWLARAGTAGAVSWEKKMTK